MEGSNSTSEAAPVNNNVNVLEAVDVKVSFRQEIRRFQLSGDVTLSVLKGKVLALFSINEPSSIVLLYRDDENDLVTMNLEEEFKYALKASKGLLRLEVRIQGEVPQVPQAPASAEPFAHDAKHWKKMGKFGHHGHPAHAHPFFGPRPHGPHAHGPHAVSPAPESFAPQEGFGRGRGRGCPRPDADGQQTSDLERGVKDRLKARHVKDITIPDGTVVLPGVPFVKTWRIRNAGTVEWPAKTRLIFISHKGDHMGGPEFVTVEGVVQPGAEVDVSVNLTAPKEAGDYSGFWRLATEEGKKFGQRVWVSVKVAADSSSSEADNSGSEHIPTPTEYEVLLKQIVDMGYTDVPKRRIQHLLYKFGGNVQTVVEKLEKRRGVAGKQGRGKREGCERKKH